MTQQFTAQGSYSDGSVRDLSATVTWTTSPAGLAAISATGMVKSTAVGDVTVSATSGAVTGQAKLTIKPAAVVSVTVSPSSASVVLGATQLFSATAHFTDNTAQDVTAQAVWGSSDTLVASALNSAGRQGVVLPRGAGSATIEAAFGNVRGTAGVQVSTLHSRFVFASEYLSISTYAVNDASGELRPLYKVPVPGWAMDLTLDPAGTFAYASGNAKLTSLAVNAATGEMKVQSEAPTGVAAYYPVVHPSGKFVYQPDVGTSHLYGYSTTNGNLQPLAGFPIPGFDAVKFDPSGKFVYGLTQIPYTLQSGVVDQQTGAITMTGSGTPGTQPIAMAMDPAGQFLYVANLWSHDVSASRIDAASGRLADIPGTPFSAGCTNPTDVAVDPSGRFLFVLCRTNPVVRAFAIADTGVLTAVGEVVLDSGEPHRLSVDPAGKMVYVADLVGGEIAALAFDGKTGTLSRRSTMRTHGSPFGLALASGANAVTIEAKSLFVSNVGGTSVSVFPVNAADGTLGAPASFPLSTGATSIAVHPAGGHLYLGNWWDNWITGFSIDAASSSLSALPNSPYVAGLNPSGLAWDPFGNYLYTASWDQLVGMKFDPATGALTNAGSQTATISGQTVVTGGGGRFLYVMGSASLAGFQLMSDGNAAALAWSPLALPVPPGGSYARAAAVDGTGRFLYVGINGYGSTSTTLLAFSINATTGELTPLSGSPFTTGNNPVSIAADGWGHFLFVGYTGGIETFAIDPLTGNLTSVGTNALPGYTLSLWVDPSSNYLYAGVGGAAELMGYRINPQSGILTRVTGAPYGGVNEPWAIAGTRTIK